MHLYRVAIQITYFITAHIYLKEIDINDAKLYISNICRVRETTESETTAKGGGPTADIIRNVNLNEILQAKVPRNIRKKGRPRIR